MVCKIGLRKAKRREERGGDVAKGRGLGVLPRGRWRHTYVLLKMLKDESRLAAHKYWPSHAKMKDSLPIGSSARGIDGHTSWDRLISFAVMLHSSRDNSIKIV
jgi:hypothetical protein